MTWINARRYRSSARFSEAMKVLAAGLIALSTSACGMSVGLSGLDDDAFFVKASGQPQDRSGSSKGPHFAWLEAYYARTQDARAAPLIAKFRPMKERRLGGDMTLLYGVELR